MEQQNKQEVNNKQVLSNIYNLVADLSVKGEDVDKVFYIRQILLNALKTEEVS